MMSEDEDVVTAKQAVQVEREAGQVLAVDVLSGTPAPPHC
jgi:hypothetical protein